MSQAPHELHCILQQAIVAEQIDRAPEVLDPRPDFVVSYHALEVPPPLQHTHKLGACTEDAYKGHSIWGGAMPLHLQE